MRGVAAILLIWLLAAPLAAAQTSPPRTSPLADWRAVVVAGDWRATDGRPIRAFDNAIRDVAAGLEARGVGRIDVFTLRPDATPKVTPDAALLRAATALPAVRPELCLLDGGRHDLRGRDADVASVIAEWVGRLRVG
jgi:hypothetical protein